MNLEVNNKIVFILIESNGSVEYTIRFGGPIKNDEQFGKLNWNELMPDHSKPTRSLHFTGAVQEDPAKRQSNVPLADWIRYIC